MTGLVFVDTAALIALLSRDDFWYVRAHEQFALLSGQRRPLLTSTAMLYELLDGAAARGPMRKAAMRLASSIRNSPQWRIVHATEEHMRASEALYASRMDKAWSLTDCTNMEIARTHDVVDVMSSDSDFEQAGFSILLRA